jgi:hypothetical protein
MTRHFLRDDDFSPAEQAEVLSDAVRIQFRDHQLWIKSEGRLGKRADFTKADRIVSLDCYFAGTDPQGPVTPFFDRRKPEGKAY